MEGGLLVVNQVKREGFEGYGKYENWTTTALLFQPQTIAF
jgi:hypothetical protein